MRAIGVRISKKTIDRLYALKRRDRQKPFAILCPDLSEVARYGVVSKFAYRTMRQLAPGPFTFVLEATRLVPDMMTTKHRCRDPIHRAIHGHFVDWR